MKLFFGLIEIDKDLILAFPKLLMIFFIVLFVLVTIAIIQLAFGDLIKRTWENIKLRMSSREHKRVHKNWLAVCKEKAGWIQNCAAESINLEGKYLKRLSFSIKPYGKPENWRAGFIIDNEKFMPHAIVDTQNAITFHVGAPPSLEKGIYVWGFYGDHMRDNPYSTMVISEGKDKTSFNIEVNENNYLSIRINDQVVHSSRIDLSFRRRVCLLAWGDHARCKVNFSDIKFVI